MVRPVALYGSECRPSIKSDAQALHVMEMKMLRWSLGFTRLDKKENTEIRSRYGVAPITDKIAEGRLRYFGHIKRQSDTSVANTALTMAVPGKRPRGRPKQSWMNNIVKDLQAVGLTPDDALNRGKWKRGIKQADPGTGRD